MNATLVTTRSLLIGLFRYLALSVVMFLSLALTCPAWASAPFIVNTNGTVTDSTTSLVWDQCPYGLTGSTCATGTALHSTWAAALAVAVSANNVSYKGSTDWRVPNKNELATLGKIDGWISGSPAIDSTAFPGTPVDWFWTSTTYAITPSIAWNTHFIGGWNSASTKTQSGYVRLVRGGQLLATYDSLNPTDTTPPTLSAVALSGIGQTSLTLTATSNEAATGYWLVVAAGATAPTAAQVKSLGNYAGVSVVSSGYGAMAATVPFNFMVSGLAAGTSYDFYVVAMDGSSNLTPTPTKVQRSTQTAATAPVVASFVFDPIADQLAGTPVPVRIKAVDAGGVTLTGFNELVTLAGLYSAKITPASLKFASGVAQANITYLGAGVAKLSAHYQNPAGAFVNGSSNQFLLQMPGVIGLYTVQGMTEPGAVLYLRSTKDGSLSLPVTADSTGKYQIGNVAVGSYEVHAEKPGFAQVCITQQFCTISVNGNLTFNPELSYSCTTGMTPVILIPGIMGSTLGNASGPIGSARDPARFGFLNRVPQLAHQMPTPADQLIIYDPYVALENLIAFSDSSAMGSNLLVADLRAAGFCVLRAPWDWRYTFQDAAKIYLTDVIATAKALTGKSKVDIVAHSMGGLVARSYIEQLGKGSDVDRFIMLGTPNYGATNAYYLMEGGDPLTLDRTTDDFKEKYIAGLAFYTATANELWLTTYQGGADIVGLSNNDITTYSDYIPPMNTQTLMGFMRNTAKSGLDLLPTYDMLTKWTRTPSLPDSVACLNGTAPTNPGMNPNLKAMNESPNFASFYAPIDGSLSTNRTQVRMFLSNSESTLNLLGVNGVGPGTTYRFGTPDCADKLYLGDGTVLANQGPGPFPANVVVTDHFGSHRQLMGNTRTQVVAALLQSNLQFSPQLGTTAATTMTAAPQTSATPTSIATIDVDGQYSALLTAGDGTRAGMVAGVGGIYEEIVNSGVSVTPYQLHIGQGSPVNGTYQLQLSADGLLANTVTRVRLNYLQPDVGTQNDSFRILVKAAPYVASIVQDSAAARWMTLVDPVKPPLALKAMPQSDATRLSWTAPVDATLTGYRIYYRPQDDDRYQLLGQTASLSFTTNIPWAGNLDSSTEFIVLAVNAAGVESPIRGANSVRNVSYARAAFSAVEVNAKGVVEQTTYPFSVNFTDQSDATAAIQSWAWDVNGDGVIDSTAQNPTFSFPLPGSYTVSLQVTLADGLTDSRTFQNFVTIRTVPNAPTIGTAFAGDAQAAISFTPPGNDGNSTISAFTASCSASGQTTQSVSGAASPLAVTGLTNGVAYACTVTATNAVGTGAASGSVSVTPKPTSRLVNLSTRGQVQTLNNVMIGGFIIQGSTPKKVLIRAVGPNLANYGVTGVLADPMLELHRSSDNSVIATNDDWGTSANASDIQATGLAPADPKEAAILMTLDPGAYTAIVTGKNAGTGVGIVEVYDIDHPEIPLVNISTRGQVQTGNNVMIGGFIIQGTSNQTVLIRAVGPNLANYGLTGVLADPMLELHRSSDNSIIATNDNWGTASNAAAIAATGLAPVSPLESAILITLPPGAYTAIVSGAGGGTGVGIVEVFAQ